MQSSNPKPAIHYADYLTHVVRVSNGCVPCAFHKNGILRYKQFTDFVYWVAGALTTHYPLSKSARAQDTEFVENATGMLARKRVQIESLRVQPVTCGLNKQLYLWIMYHRIICTRYYSLKGRGCLYSCGMISFRCFLWRKRGDHRTLLWRFLFCARIPLTLSLCSEHLRCSQW